LRYGSPWFEIGPEASVCRPVEILARGTNPIRPQKSRPTKSPRIWDTAAIRRLAPITNPGGLEAAYCFVRGDAAATIRSQAISIHRLHMHESCARVLRSGWRGPFSDAKRRNLPSVRRSPTKLFDPLRPGAAVMPKTRPKIAAHVNALSPGCVGRIRPDRVPRCQHFKTGPAVRRLILTKNAMGGRRTASPDWPPRRRIVLIAVDVGLQSSAGIRRTLNGPACQLARPMVRGQWQQASCRPRWRQEARGKHGPYTGPRRKSWLYGTLTSRAASMREF